MPRPTPSAVTRRQRSANRACCSWAGSASSGSRVEPVPAGRSAIGREEHSSRRTLGRGGAI
eukprot:scaffold6996_cov112-Isochrysis_galbana.AAC.4